MEKKTLVSYLYLSCVSTPLVITPPCNPAGVCSLSLALIETVSTPPLLAHPLVSTPPVMSRGSFTRRGTR